MARENEPNEIDDILNELKNKGDGQRKSGNNADDFFNSFTPPPQKREENDFKSMTFEPDDTVTQSALDSSDDKRHNNFSLLENTNGGIRENIVTPFEFEDESDYDEPPRDGNGGKKKGIIIAIVAILVVALVAGAVFVFAKNRDKEEETTTAKTTTQSTTQAPVVVLNPLTGEEDFNTSAVGKRPVACVVENSSQARPQWGIDSTEHAPDIILEGEVEGGETRMLWMYADYTDLPDQIGPMRSARPPYIRFSQLFDSIFIHWGQSSSKGNYVGADTVFSTENVDHINQMTYSDSVGLFDRDYSRGVSSEHTGILYGAKLSQAIDGMKFRTDANSKKYTTLSFNSKATTLSETKCNALGLTFSSSTYTRDWTYSTEDKMYHSTDYQTDVERKNLLVLFDTTQYVVKENYKGSGNSETYCDYKLAGGNGKLASQGTVIDITWSVSDGLLSVKDSSGKEVSLNKGTTWIGWGSSNNGGNVKVTGAAATTTE